LSTITLIAAAAENNALGLENDLPWHLPDDFDRFKRLTIGKTIIMGRKTFESLPKPLPKRYHIIITRNQNYTLAFPNGKVVHSLDDALQHVAHEHQVYVIGGGEIYKQALPYAHRIELTRIHATLDADTFFPEIDANDWEIVSEVYHPDDTQHQYAFSFITYEKK